MKLHRTYLWVSMMAVAGNTTAQKIYIADYSVTVRQFQPKGGEYPPELLYKIQNPTDFIARVQYTHSGSWDQLGFGRGVSSEAPVYTYANIGWKIRGTRSRFWAKTTLLTGLQFSNRLETDAGVADRRVIDPNPASDTFSLYVRYNLSKKYQMYGFHVGLNRIYPLTKRLNTSISLLLQNNRSSYHYYTNYLDSLIVFRNAPSSNRRTELSDMTGNPFSELRILLPIRFEYKTGRFPLFLRAEINLGVQYEFISSMKEMKV